MAGTFSAKGLFDISGRTVIVTGGAVGIGKVYSRALGEVGANVAIVDIEAEAGEKLAAEIESRSNETGGHAMFMETDVTDMTACEKLAEATLARFGRIDGLVNNAALYAKILRNATTGPRSPRTNGTGSWRSTSRASTTAARPCTRP